MTKRMLSLLLALVMTLSLCVPALAADDFAAEAVTETGEQAPVDPVAEDAPEAAAIDEAEAASTYVVAVTDEVYKKLVQNIEEAADDVAAVKAHTKMTLDSNATKAINDIIDQLDKVTGDDGKDNLIVKYEAAVLLRDQINGEGATLTDKDVEDAIDDLRRARQNLSSETTIELDDTAIKTITKSGFASDYWFTEFNGTSKWLEDNLELMELIRRADYVEKLIAAVVAAERYTEDASTKQPVKALWDAIEDLWELRVGKKAEDDAKTPTDAEAAELKKLYDATKAKFDDKKNYVAATTTATKDWINGDGTTAYANVETGLGIIGALFDKTHTNQFVTDTSYFNYARAMKNIKLLDKNIKAKDTLIDFNGYAVNSTRTSIDVYLSMESVTGKTDDNQYELWVLEKKNLVDVKDADAGNDGTITSSDFTDGELTVGGAWGGSALKEGDKITFNLYKIVDGKKELVKSLVVDDIDEHYSGPKFRTKATYVTKSGSTQFDVNGYLTCNLNDTGTVAAYEIALTADGKDPVKLDGSGTTSSNGSVTTTGFTFDADAVKKVVTNKGDYKLTLKVQMNDTEKGLIPRGETTVTVPALEKYKAATPISAPLNATVANVRAMAGTSGNGVKGVDDLQTFVTAVKGLPESLVLVEANGGDYVESLATAKALLATAVTDAEKVITDSATLAYNETNVKKVTDAAGALQKVLGYLAEGADTTAFDKALATAKALVKSDYTTNSWLLSGIEAAITAAEKAVKDHETYGFVDDAATRKDLKAKTKALNDAMEKLVAVGADKAALNAAIKAAEALKEEDYTAESWKAADLATVIAAAKLVAAKDNAGQTEIDAAIASLTAAQAKLVKKATEQPTGPKAPASGTGWTLYEGDWYFFKNGTMVKNYWVGQADGASQWSTNWYYVGSDGKMATGMQYIDDLHGGYGWYYLQETNNKGEIGKMLTGFQWVGGEYGECYFSAKNGESGKCTWSELKGNWNGTTFVK